MTTWRECIPEEDRSLTEAAGLGRKAALGVRPALLVIDVQYRTAGDTPLPIRESMKQYPTSCGTAAWDAIEVIRRLLEAARGQRVPVLYGVVERANVLDARTWAGKIPSFTEAQHRRGHVATEIVREIAPTESDVVVSKRYASCFFGTPLITYLRELDVDTLIVTGCTTSGCVRATAVDAFSYGFRVIVVEDGVYDRSAISHAVSLFDMDSKYGNVMASGDVIGYLKGVPGTRRD